MSYGRETLAQKTPRVLAALDAGKLKEVIAMPEWERQLHPLFLFKGTKPYRIRALFNIAYGMFLTECDSLSLGAHSIGCGDVGRLCGVHSVPQGIRSVFDRLRACPEVSNSFSKAFTEYVEWVYPHPFHLDRVPYEDKNYKLGRTAWWRVPAAKRPKMWRMPEPKSTDAAYPYIRGPHSADHKLLLDVHACLPKGLPHDIRGDLCQDMIVAILSGETTVENIPDVVAQYARQARKMLPDKWRTVSLDAPTFEDGEGALHDVIGGQGHDECGGGEHHHYSEESDALLTALDR